MTNQDLREKINELTAGQEAILGKLCNMPFDHSVQSASVCVPGKGCIANCRGCVSRMHTWTFPKKSSPLPQNKAQLDRYINAFKYCAKRTDNLMITGANVDPLQNHQFLMWLLMMVDDFTKREIQSIGVNMNKETARFLAEDLLISVFSLSVWGLKDETNQMIERLPERKVVVLENVCNLIKKSGMILRLSLNVNSFMLEDVDYDIPTLFERCEELGADEVTIRKLWAAGDSEEAQWVRKNAVDTQFFNEVVEYAVANAKEINSLPTGYALITMNSGIRLVVDLDCMNEKKTEKRAQKYLVIRSDEQGIDGRVFADWGPHSKIL